ncbi:aldehyde dehydrogenase [Moniliophthora roreri MCA 2997]|uniref:Aldehyde dehydrogenase n=1 Tax=Moniliophthora roreri (strain MCA 2997) TaxID=1381753 RepID=V2XPI4_MONRO|nr:aldehyde dehydrogenase [Moniliophthora roreri MCA 2997]
MSTPKIFKQEINTTLYKGTVSVNTGLFIGGEFVNPVDGGTIDVVNPATGKPVTTVSIGTEKDVDIAVEAAKKAFKTSWGLKVPGAERGHLLKKLADLIEANTDEFAALESLNIGKPFAQAKGTDVIFSIDIIRYYAGFADKVHAKTIETNESKFAYTRREPYGVVGQITPWNAPLLMVCLKIAPALATGNTIVLKPSEMTPLTALKLASLIKEIFPPGVVNIVNGYGQTVGSAIAHHPQISKIAFTGSTLTGRKIQEASAKSNLKVVSLELGGKSPNIIFDDTNLDQAAKWAAKGVYMNMGQACIAGSRIFVQEGIYDRFVAAFQEATKAWSEQTGDPFEPKTEHGPQISQTQFDRVLGYIDSAKQDGATILTGGSRHGNEGFFVQPTIITDTTPDMKVVREEIFGPVATLIKFKTEEEVIEMANNTSYGLACGVFTENNARAIRVAHALEAGTAWVNCYSWFDKNVPFGGYKMSGFGRELGAESIDSYTQVKAVHVNIGLKI